MPLPRGRGRRDRGPGPRGPGLTPLIDVVFILLIFFMLATRFDRIDALEARTAGASAGAAASVDDPVALIDLLADGRARLAGRAAPLERLIPALPDARLILRPADGVTLAALIAARDRLIAAGHDRVVLLAEER